MVKVNVGGCSSFVKDADFQKYVQLRKERKDYLIARKNLELLLAREEAEKEEKAKAKPSRSSRSEASL